MEVNPGNAREIAATIPYSWDPAALTVRFAVTPAGATISPDPNGAIDYSQPVVFSITANGLTSAYTVSLTSVTPPGFYIESSRAAQAGIGSFADARDYLKDYAAADTSYLYVFGADESAVNIVLNAAALNSQAGVKLALEGSGEERTLQLTGGTSSQSLFVVQAGTLQLRKNITLKGAQTGYTAALVTVNGGALELYDGAKICGHTNTDTFNGNYTNNAGGVFVNGGSFHLYGGEISGNEGKVGAGVKVYSGTFGMEGGLIAQNKALGSGGGINFTGGTSFITGGVIRGNTARDSAGLIGTGGGIQLSNNAVVTMTGGLITTNEANGFVF